MRVWRDETTRASRGRRGPAPAAGRRAAFAPLAAHAAGRRPWLLLRVALIVTMLPLATAAPVRAASHLVQPGETLGGIAEFYGLSPAQLAAANGLDDPDRLAAGSALVIPTGQAGGSTYVVVPGDTLEGIAATFGTSVAGLLAANPALDDPDLIAIGQALTIPGGGGVVAAATASDSAIAVLLRDTARRYGLDPALVQAVAWQESGWRQGAVSPAGAIGVMQLLPPTAAWVAEDLVGRPLDIEGSAADNILAGVALLSWLLDFAGDEDLALAYYVQGQGNVARDGIYAETWGYIAAVNGTRNHIARFGTPPS